MKKLFAAVTLSAALVTGLVTGTMRADAKSEPTTQAQLQLLDMGDRMVRAEMVDAERAVTQALKVSVANKKPCRTKKSTRCTWADSYHYGDTLSWWRGTGTKWNITNKRARERLEQFFRTMYGEPAGALKFGGKLHPYCWWNDAGTAVLCGDGARHRY